MLNKVKFSVVVTEKENIGYDSNYWPKALQAWLEVYGEEIEYKIIECREL